MRHNYLSPFINHDISVVYREVFLQDIQLLIIVVPDNKHLFSLQPRKKMLILEQDVSLMPYSILVAYD